MEKNKGGAPKGNKNAQNNAIAGAALKKALAIKDGKEPTESRETFQCLVDMWSMQIDEALMGDKHSLNMIVERLDGKPGQSIDLGPDTTVHFHLDYKSED